MKRKQKILPFCTTRALPPWEKIAAYRFNLEYRNHYVFPALNESRKEGAKQ